MRSLLILGCILWVPGLFASVMPYAGAIGGIATLSADAGSQATSQGLKLSSYGPTNGGALNVFVGAHLHNYFSLQVNYIWNRNDLVLNSSASGSGTFYEQARSSSQHAGVVDFLLYFRNRSSWIRPYLGTGGGIIHLNSIAERLTASGGSPILPPSTFSSTRPVFRSHVGMDIRISKRVDFRYSFSEFIGKNDISKHLSPPAPRRLANFQNLFGFVVHF
jgi:Outer membrane protein beta-barrel domain